MKTSTLVPMAILLFGVAFTSNAQKLKKFGSSIEKKIGPKTIKVPYTDSIKYLGYASPGNEDEVKDNKKFYYIYVWVPIAAPELGVRMVSPVKDKMKGAIESKGYLDNKGSEDFFDTYITLERSDIVSKDGVTEEGAKSANWVTFESNDDSSEMPTQPSGNDYNSLLRYSSDTSNPTKAIVAGLYRVGFTTYKTGEVKGTFMAEVAAPVKIPGVVMAKTITELKAQMAE